MTNEETKTQNATSSVSELLISDYVKYRDCVRFLTQKLKEFEEYRSFNGPLFIGDNSFKFIDDVCQNICSARNTAYESLTNVVRMLLCVKHSIDVSTCKYYKSNIGGVPCCLVPMTNVSDDCDEPTDVIVVPLNELFTLKQFIITVIPSQLK